MGETPEWLRIGVGGVVPVQWELSKDAVGEISGWASVYNVIDSQDDIVLPGAFKRTINAWKASGRTIPLVLDHEHDTDGIIGSITDMKDTPTGLRFSAKFSSVPRAQEARTKAREGDLTGLSIFGPIIHKSFEMRDQRELRLLHEVGLWEISMTGFPANDRAMLTAVKAGLPLDDEEWVADLRAALAIRSKAARKAAFESLIIAAYPVLGTPVKEPPTVPEGDGDKPELDDAAKYALDFLGDTGPDDSPPGGDSDDPLADLDQLMASFEAEKHRQEIAAIAAELRGESA